jgi:GrpB-like predicted nucleotidyltransferase (UPF0157 family)
VTTDPVFTERVEGTPEELEAAWVDGPPPPAPVVVVAYEPTWPQLYRREERRIREVLGDRVITIEHVGSTAVPGLAAKAIIDIDLTVANSADEEAYVPTLTAAGYRLTIREPNWHEHRLLKGPDTNVNVHVFSPGSPETIRHLVFRDWLREHPEDIDQYAETKRRLADRATDIRAYTQAKNDIIDDIYRRAFAVWDGTERSGPSN